MTFRFKKLSIPFALLVTCFLSYGLLIPWLGFYWDDWPYTWYAHLLGPSGFTQVFAGDRPFLSVIYALTSQVVGTQPLNWQIFCIVSRWTAVLAFWWSLQIIWPKARRQVTWAAFIFAVFPGFGQQWISVIYSRAFLLMALFFLSFGFMAKAIRSSRKPLLYTILGVICSLFALFSSEYFFGIELMRPFFIWYICYEGAKPLKTKISTALKYWSPYLILWLAFAVWRIFFFTSENYDIQATGSLTSDPKNAILQLVQVLSETVFDSGITIWTETLKVFTQPLNSLSTWLTIGIVVAGFVLVSFYLWNLDSSEYSEQDEAGETDRWGIQASVVGFAGIVLAVIPFWAAGLPIKLIFPWDRFMLVIMVGASLLFVGLLEFLVKTERRKIILLSLAVALSMGKHFETANTYRRDWNNQKEFFWQLLWRAADIDDGTMLLTHELPLQYYSDNSLTAPLNWIYAPQLDNKEMPYIMVFLKARLGNSLPDLSPDQNLTFDYRALEFNGSSSDSIVFFYSTDSCLRILDNRYSPADTFNELPYQLTDAIGLSNLERIFPENKLGQASMQPYFSPEPTHGWCYYFEKADLARQYQDWDEIIALGKQADELFLSPKHPSEYLPFIEGYSMAGDMAKAEELTHLYLAGSGDELLPSLCRTWERIAEQKSDDTDFQSAVQEFRSTLNCSN